jgi:hypothetical protein
LCTLLVVFSAFQFVNHEWAFFYHFLQEELNMSGSHGLSTGYWIGFTLIIVPGMLIAKLLSNPKVPFPSSVEQYGTMIAGVLVGTILFATVIQSLSKFDFFQASVAPSLGHFRILFRLLGSLHVGL